MATSAVIEPKSRNRDDDSLLARTWQLALTIKGLPPDEVEATLDSLFDAALAAPPEERGLALEDLVGHLELFPSERRRRLSEAYLESKRMAEGECACGATPDEEEGRLARRMSMAEQHRRPVASPVPGLASPAASAPLVVLVVPDFLSAGTFLQPPLEFLLAATRLRLAGFACRLIDNRVLNLGADGLARVTRNASLIAVLTTPYDHIQNYFVDYRLRHALATADALKNAWPAVPLALCGAHGTVRPDLIFRDCAADYVVRGELDTALPGLAVALRDGEDLDAAMIRRGDPVGPVGPEGAIASFRLVDLDHRFRARRVPDGELRPSYDLVDLDAYYGDFYEGASPRRQGRWVTLLASRGCAYDCAFCFNFWGRRTRRRLPEEVADEMAWAERDLNASGAFFLDFDFTEKRDWVDSFCDEVERRRIRLSWSAQTRCDLVDLDLLHRMRAAGCHGLWFGVESFDPLISEGLRKYGDLDAAAHALEACAGSGVKPHLFVMIGAPGETRGSLNTTIRHMHRWKAAYCGVMPTTPRFGTALYRKAKSQFPGLGDDFYSLRAVRGLVDNELGPDDLQQALGILQRKSFMDLAEPPQLAAA